MKQQIVMSIPAWSVCYLFNDDPSGLSDEDIEAVDQWVKSMIEDGYNVSSLSPVDVEEEPRFTTRPAFGLACDCVECVCEI